MAAASGSLHERVEDLHPETIERHRAIVSVMEELEAVDWYDQRANATGDGELRSILEHNRDEEKEHAAMTLEWLRRNDPQLDQMLRTYLFTEGSVVEEEEESSGDGAAGAPGDGSLGIGDLRLRREGEVLR